MAPLIVLLATFVVLVLVRRFLAPRALSFSLCGRAAMSAMLLLTGSSHVLMTDQLAEMLPPAVPIRTEIIYATGALELLAAVGLLAPATSRLTSWCPVRHGERADVAVSADGLRRGPGGAIAGQCEPGRPWQGDGERQSSGQGR